MIDHDGEGAGRELVTGWGGPLVRLVAGLLLAISLWGAVDLIRLWNRPIELASGTPGPVVEEQQDGRFEYLLPFADEETGTELVFRLRNHGAVIDYFMDRPAAPVAILYWPGEMQILSVYPLAADQDPIRGRYPPYNALLLTSVLGALVAAVLLLGGRLDRALYRLGRG